MSEMHLLRGVVELENQQTCPLPSFNRCSKTSSFKFQSFFCPQVTREPEPNSCESLKKCKSYHPEPNEYVPGPAGKSAPVPAPANIKLALDPVQSDFLAMNIKNSETAGRPYNIHELPSVDGTSAFLPQTSEDYQSKPPIATRSFPWSSQTSLQTSLVFLEPSQ